MPTHIVTGDEWIGSIAEKYGFPSWTTIWKHSGNAALRKNRDPNMLMAGDKVFIPPLESTKASDKGGLASGSSGEKLTLTAAKGNWLRIRVVEFKTYLDLFGKIPYELSVGSGTAGGEIEKDKQEIEIPLPLGVKTGTLKLGDNVYDLVIGGLAPLNTTAGMQARINNLGWDAGPVDGDNGPKTKRGVKDFQAYYQITVDGKIGSETRGKAKEVHGC